MRGSSRWLVSATSASGPKAVTAGASVSNHLALRHPERIAGIHLNLMSAGPPAAKTDFHRRGTRPSWNPRANGPKYHLNWECGYVHQQRTRPQTLGTA